jgi:hypothetical protein
MGFATAARAGIGSAKVKRGKPATSKKVRWIEDILFMICPPFLSRNIRDLQKTGKGDL